MSIRLMENDLEKSNRANVAEAIWDDTRGVCAILLHLQLIR